jgi:hypothetical protein
MQTNNKPKQMNNKHFGYILLVLGMLYIGYYIFISWRKETSMTLVPGLTLLTISTVLITKKKESK